MGGGSVDGGVGVDGKIDNSNIVNSVAFFILFMLVLLGIWKLIDIIMWLINIF